MSKNKPKDSENEDFDLTIVAAMVMRLIDVTYSF